MTLIQEADWDPDKTYDEYLDLSSLLNRVEGDAERQSDLKGHSPT
jgi:hypothetical protein